jgi:hypothetical protein
MMEKLELTDNRILAILGNLRGLRNQNLVVKNRMPPDEMSSHPPMRKQSLHRRIRQLCELLRTRVIINLIKNDCVRIHP